MIINFLRKKIVMDARGRAAPVLDPGPEDPSVLYLHRQHISEAVWKGHVSNYY